MCIFFVLFVYWISTLSPESRAPVSVYISTLSTVRRGAGLSATVPSPTETWRSIRRYSLYEMWENCVTRAWQTTSLLLFSFCRFSPSSPSFDHTLSLYFIVTWLQVFVWDHTVTVHRTLFSSSSVSVSLFRTKHESRMKNIILHGGVKCPNC